MSRAVHFEIQASNPQALIDYYTGLFGWSFNKWEGGQYWLIHTGPEEKPGINGGLLPRRGPAPAVGQPVNAFVCTVDVDDLETTLAQAHAAGAHLALATMPIPGVGWLAYVHDTEGNLLGLMQSDPTASAAR